MIDCITWIAEQISEELMDSTRYIHEAEKWRDKHPELAELYKELSAEELNHAERLHEEGTKIVDGSDDHDTVVV